jgi:hypothetical protein
MTTLTTFASRQPAAFIRGTVFDHEVTTSAEMLRLANLNDWNVHLRPLNSDARRKTETFEVVRTNPFDGLLDRLGVAGERYGTAQNEQTFGMLDDLNPVWEAAGSFKGGAIVYGQAKVDREIVIDPQGVADVIKPMISVITTHDSSGALVIGRDALRLACFNQFKMMLKGLSETVKIRHTLTIQDRMKKIRLAWKSNNLYFDALDAEANALFQKACTDNQFFTMVNALIGERPEENVKGSQTKWENNRELYAQAWKGETNAALRGTAFGAFQAMRERQQWGRQLRGRDEAGNVTDEGLDNFAMASMGLDQATGVLERQSLALVRAL